jgi:hypothetical protein
VVRRNEVVSRDKDLTPFQIGFEILASHHLTSTRSEKPFFFPSDSIETFQSRKESLISKHLVTLDYQAWASFAEECGQRSGVASVCPSFPDPLIYNPYQHSQASLISFSTIYIYIYLSPNSFYDHHPSHPAFRSAHYNGILHFHTRSRHPPLHNANPERDKNLHYAGRALAPLYRAQNRHFEEHPKGTVVP